VIVEVIIIAIVIVMESHCFSVFWAAAHSEESRPMQRLINKMVNVAHLEDEVSFSIKTSQK